MFGVEPLARIVRHDARIEVKVPAAKGKKAYSYFREGGEGEKKSSGVGKKAALIGGGLALAGLGAAAIAVKQGVIDGSPKSVETYNKYKARRNQVESSGIPTDKKYACKGMDDALAKSVYAAESMYIEVPRNGEWNITKSGGIGEVYKQFIEDYDQISKEGLPEGAEEIYEGRSEGLKRSLYVAEQRIKNRGEEVIFAFDKEGSLLGLGVGDRASVGLKIAAGREQDVEVTTHNHPAESGFNFLPFSKEDVNGFASSPNLKEVRVASGDFLFSLRNEKGFKAENEAWREVSKATQPASRKAELLYEKKRSQGKEPSDSDLLPLIKAHSLASDTALSSKNVASKGFVYKKMKLSQSRIRLNQDSLNSRIDALRDRLKQK